MAYPKPTGDESDKYHLKWEDQDKKEGFLCIWQVIWKDNVEVTSMCFFSVLVMCFLNRTKIVIRGKNFYDPVVND